MFTVTKQWLDDNKTTSGGYTQSQLAVFGIVSWPPPKGWMGMVVGSQISFPQKHSFEAGAKKDKEGGALKACLRLIKKLNTGERAMLAEHLKQK